MTSAHKTDDSTGNITYFRSNLKNLRVCFWFIKSPGNPKQTTDGDGWMYYRNRLMLFQKLIYLVLLALIAFGLPRQCNKTIENSIKPNISGVMLNDLYLSVV